MGYIIWNREQEGGKKGERKRWRDGGREKRRNTPDTKELWLRRNHCPLKEKPLFTKARSARTTEGPESPGDLTGMGMHVARLESSREKGRPVGGEKAKGRAFSPCPAGSIPLSTQQRLLVSRVGSGLVEQLSHPRKAPEVSWKRWMLGHSAGPADGQSCPLPASGPIHALRILCRMPSFVLYEYVCVYGWGCTHTCVFSCLQVCTHVCV